MNVKLLNVKYVNNLIKWKNVMYYFILQIKDK